MYKNKIFIIIIFITIVLGGIIIFISSSSKYNKMVKNNIELKRIINSRKSSTELKLTELKFNDYKLFIDEDNSIVYYSVVDIKNKLNPSFKFKTNSNAKIAFNSVLDEVDLEVDDFYKVIIYDKDFYREYFLCLTKYPLMNIAGKNIVNNDSVEMELFDNHINRPQKYMKSDAKFRIEDDRYILRLKKDSIGRNKRNNPISILGFDKANEFILKKTYVMVEREKYVRLFINYKYDGFYYVNPVSGLDGR